jgi:hypothetical protein
MSPVAAFELGHEEPEEDFRPALAAWDRISLAWWADEDRDHERGPLFTAERATLVVVWPTDAAGLLLADQLDHTTVRWWTPNERAYAELTKLHQTFPLGQHDFVLRMDRMRPHNMSGLLAVMRSREPRHRQLWRTLEAARRRLLR